MDGKWNETAHHFDCGLLFSSAACKCLTFVIKIGACAATKRQHVVLELGSKRSILLENMDLRTPKLFHKCMCNELFSGTASAVQTFSETLRLTLSGRQSFFVRHFPDACTCRSVASNPTCRHLSGICSKARKDLTVQSVEKKNKFKSRNMPKSLVCKENSENKTQNLETCYVYKDNLRQLQDLLDLSSGPPFTEKATFRTEFRRS